MYKRQGKYTLKFIGGDGYQYPSVINVTVDPGEQETVRVDLNLPYDAAEETAGGAEE